jgi:hypothetical protein
MVSRTGFTGDLGYELWMEPADAERVGWLMEQGRTRGIRPIGSQALEHRAHRGGVHAAEHRFRVRRAYAAHRHASARRSSWALGWLVDFKKGHFTGRRALLEEQRAVRAASWSASTSRVTSRRTTRCCTPTSSGKREVGSVTSATWSPTCKRNIALAMVDAPHFKMGSTVWAEIYLNRELVWERRMARRRSSSARFLRPSAAAPRHRRTSERACHDRNPAQIQRRSSLARPDAKPQIVIEGSTRRYGAFTAVDNVNLQIYKGEMFAWSAPRAAARPRCCACWRDSRARARVASHRRGGDEHRAAARAAGQHDVPVVRAVSAHEVERNVGYGLKRMPWMPATRKKRIQGARHGAAGARWRSASRINSPAASGSAWRWRAR